MLTFCLLLSSCGKNNEDNQENPDFGGSIDIFAYTPDTLNPLLTVHQTNAAVFSLLCDSLLNLNNDMTVSCNVAESFSCNEDGSVWTFNIKKGYVFSDGSILTAQNVINSIDMLRSSPKNMYYPLMTYVKSYRAVSDYAVELTLKIRGNTFLSYMNFPIVKSRSEIVGSGPYVVKSEDKDKIVLEASDTKKTNIKTMNVNIYPKNDMEVNAYMSNETDVINADFYSLAELSSSARSNQTEYISDYFTFLGFNTQSETMSDINIRKAVASLINKEEITEQVFVNHAKITNSPFKPGTVYSNLTTNDYEYNLNKAEKFLTSSEMKFEDISFSILVNEETVCKKQVAEFIAGKLTQAGMNVTVNAVSFETYLQKIRDKDFVAFIGEIKMPKEYDVSFMFSTSGNNFGYVREDFTSALHGFIYAKTQDDKLIHCENIQKILLEDVPLVSLFYRNNTLFTDSTIMGDFNPLQDNIYNGITNWKIKN